VRLGLSEARRSLDSFTTRVRRGGAWGETGYVWSVLTDRGRRYSALFLLLTSSVAVGVMVGTDSEWARYFFSSLFQGFCALVGLLLTGLIVGLQFARGIYGPSAASRHVLGDPFVSTSLAFYVGVISLSLLALGLGSGPSWAVGLFGFLCLGGAEIALFLSALTLPRLLRGIAQDAVIPDLVERLLTCAAYSDAYNEAAIDVEKAFRSLATADWAEWVSGWEAYQRAIHEEGRREWKYDIGYGVSPILGPIERLGDLPERHADYLLECLVLLANAWLRKPILGEQAIGTLGNFFSGMPSSLLGHFLLTRWQWQSQEDRRQKYPLIAGILAFCCAMGYKDMLRSAFGDQLKLVPSQYQFHIHEMLTARWPDRHFAQERLLHQIESIVGLPPDQRIIDLVRGYNSYGQI
jgi:hypothetical protein